MKHGISSENWEDYLAGNLPPEARYRSEENRLYRVEIHNGGQAGSGATFKWSRDNGSVTFPVDTMALDTESKIITVTLKSLPRDTMLSLEPGNWVEIVDDSYVLQGRNFMAEKSFLFGCYHSTKVGRE